VPGSITDYPVRGRNKCWNLVLQVGYVSNLGQQNIVMSPVGLRPKKDCAGRAQQHLYTTDPYSRQRGHPTLINSQLSEDNYKKRKTGHGSQMGA
jgi:hypothetical protein